MTYDYVCDACQHAWELEQRISDAPIIQCPACGSSRAHRVISGGVGFILKGVGWGKDLYASKKSSVKKEE
jgi:putative FmdB family regulatory protein